MSYRKFLAKKRMVVQPSGIDDPPGLSPKLFPFQRDITRWALRIGKAAVWADCGLGKSWISIEWARCVADHTGKPVLILTPLAVAQQFVDEGVKLGVEVRYLADPDDGGGIVVTNYEKLHRFEAPSFGGVVLDECFAAGTPVDTPDGPRSIETIRKGDIVCTVAGDGAVRAVARRRKRSVVRVVLDDGQVIVCSENHMFFRTDGWARATTLKHGDRLWKTNEAMRVVQGHVRHGENAAEAEVLRSIVLGEMENDSAGDTGQGPLSRGRGEARASQECVVEEWPPGCTGGTCQGQGNEPNDEPGDEGEGVRHFAGNGSPSAHPGRERARPDLAAADAVQPAGGRVVPGIRRVAREAEGRVSHPLQAGYCQPVSDDGNRGRRPKPPSDQAKESRQEEGRDAWFARVASVEVLESRDTSLSHLNCGKDTIPLYDLEVDGHPSFSVNGVFVHNSSILKDYTSKTRNQLVEGFASTLFRLCCTATPAPNDFIELGNHAAFLGTMTRQEMLSMFFVHDGGSTQDWRLKGHAESEFWKWLSSWAVNLKSPADLGYDDAGYVLPALNIKHHVVASDCADVAKEAGLLFASEAKGLHAQRAARKSSLTDRVKLCADMVNASDEPWIVWCDLNAESDALAAAIEGAVEVRGSDSSEVKESRIWGFIRGEHRVLVTKPSIAGHGLNMQHCRNVAFVGVSHSFERWYQAIRRCWRFGQDREVNCHVITSEQEGAVVANLQRKQEDSDRLTLGMVEHMSEMSREQLVQTERTQTVYEAKKRMRIPAWLKSAE